MEALQNNLGVGGTLLRHSCNITEGIDNCDGVFPDGYWFNLVYGTAVLLFCLAVCLIGAGKYHRENVYLNNVLLCLATNEKISDSVIVWTKLHLIGNIV